MARIRWPLNITSVTFTTSGVVVPDASGFTDCTALEATALVQSYAQPVIRRTTGAGVVTLWLSGSQAVVSSLSVNGVAKAISADGQLPNNGITALEANQMIQQGVGLVFG